MGQAPSLWQESPVAQNTTAEVQTGKDMSLAGAGHAKIYLHTSLVRQLDCFHCPVCEPLI